MLAELAIANFDSAQKFIMAKRLGSALKAAIESLWIARSKLKTLPKRFAANRRKVCVVQVIDLNKMLKLQQWIIPLFNLFAV
jgi:hypothetical protein